MPLSKFFRASWSIGLAAALLAAVPLGRIAKADNIVGDAARLYQQPRAPSAICGHCRTSLP